MFPCLCRNDQFISPVRHHIHFGRLLQKYKCSFIIRLTLRINPVSICKIDKGLQIPDFLLFLLLTDILRDMCRLSVTREYSLSSGTPELLTRSFTYRESAPSYPAPLLPRLYCESAMCGDRDMCERISRADMFNSLGGCRGFCTPPHLQLGIEKTALLRPCAGGYNAEIYSFIVGDMIEKISREG